MTWKMMSPAEACDVMDFLESLTWPLTKPVAHQSLVDKFDWTIGEARGKERLINSRSDLSSPGVNVITGGEQVMTVDMRTTDIIRDITDESLEFLGDAFVLLVREGEKRWGKPTTERDGTSQDASWATPADGRIRFSGSNRGVLIEYRTPQGIDIERRERRFA